ncbi:Predicted outer membrane protein [Legionella busanensis]|uniref:Predicted outer membrane protein n=1 Tax=Legionella busanensis TaxID=190655 RepID=A0A378JRC1_9GAMM|nr:DUF4142 domain-containing protein [Legionella busanensis]STX50672.1 Predicted outer membrane protein [Legionella busanensis]
MKLKLATLSLLSTFTMPIVFAAATTNSTDNATTQTTATQHNAGNVNQTNTSSNQQANNQQNQKDSQILGILVVLNQNEISAADLVTKKKDVNSSVKKYAKMLAKEHSKNLKETMKLSHSIGSPIHNDTANNLKQKGQDELNTLNPLTGAALDKAYIDAMVQDHQQAIQLFDNDLLPSVSNKKLKNQLTETRKHLVKHLEEAQQIQKKLDKMDNAASTSNQSNTTNTSNTAQ